MTLYEYEYEYDIIDRFVRFSTCARFVVDVCRLYGPSSLHFASHDQSKAVVCCPANNIDLYSSAAQQQALEQQ